MRLRGIALSLATTVLTHPILALKVVPLQPLFLMPKRALPAGTRVAKHYKRSFATMSRESSFTGHDSTSMNSPIKIFCDLDGVLADFDAGVLRACGQRPDEMSAREMWSRLAR